MEPRIKQRLGIKDRLAFFNQLDPVALFGPLGKNGMSKVNEWLAKDVDVFLREHDIEDKSEVIRGLQNYAWRWFYAIGDSSVQIGSYGYHEWEPFVKGARVEDGWKALAELIHEGEMGLDDVPEATLRFMGLTDEDGEPTGEVVRVPPIANNKHYVRGRLSSLLGRPRVIPREYIVSKEPDFLQPDYELHPLLESIKNDEITRKGIDLVEYEPDFYTGPETVVLESRISALELNNQMQQKEIDHLKREVYGTQA